MTIRRGEPWGHASTVPADTPSAADDGALASLPDRSTAILTGGDVWDCLGRPNVPDEGAPCTILPVDGLRWSIVRTDGGVIEGFASSSIVIGRWTRPGHRFVCMTNTGIHDGRNIAPRAHPNDGRMDILSIDDAMPWRQRVAAWRRSRTGTHVPHPAIELRQATDFSIDARQPGELLRIDGSAPFPSWSDGWMSLSVSIAPDRWRVVV